jgi:hypothetical protein
VSRDHAHMRTPARLEFELVLFSSTLTLTLRMESKFQRLPSKHSQRISLAFVAGIGANSVSVSVINLTSTVPLASTLLSLSISRYTYTRSRTHARTRTRTLTSRRRSASIADSLSRICATLMRSLGSVRQHADISSNTSAGQLSGGGGRNAFVTTSTHACVGDSSGHGGWPVNISHSVTPYAHLVCACVTVRQHTQNNSSSSSTYTSDAAEYRLCSIDSGGIHLSGLCEYVCVCARARTVITTYHGHMHTHNKRSHSRTRGPSLLRIRHDQCHARDQSQRRVSRCRR